MMSALTAATTIAAAAASATTAAAAIAIVIVIDVAVAVARAHTSVVAGDDMAAGLDAVAAICTDTH